MQNMRDFKPASPSSGQKIQNCHLTCSRLTVWPSIVFIKHRIWHLWELWRQSSKNSSGNATRDLYLHPLLDQLFASFSNPRGMLRLEEEVRHHKAAGRSQCISTIQIHTAQVIYKDGPGDMIGHVSADRKPLRLVLWLVQFQDIWSKAAKGWIKQELQKYCLKWYRAWHPNTSWHHYIRIVINAMLNLLIFCKSKCNLFNSMLAVELLIFFRFLT